jgi:hypothetical protein
MDELKCNDVIIPYQIKEKTYMEGMVALILAFTEVEGIVKEEFYTL